jgi:hypothetical protein
VSESRSSRREDDRPGDPAPVLIVTGPPGADAVSRRLADGLLAI